MQKPVGTRHVTSAHPTRNIKKKITIRAKANAAIHQIVTGYAPHQGCAQYRVLRTTPGLRIAIINIHLKADAACHVPTAD